jgi:hypothetical protein
MLSVSIRGIGVSAPVNPSRKRPESRIWMLSIEDASLVIQFDVAEAGGEKKVIVAPISPGLGAPIPSTKS